jgi:hypothetical protein
MKSTTDYSTGTLEVRRENDERKWSQPLQSEFLKENAGIGFSKLRENP